MSLAHKAGRHTGGICVDSRGQFSAEWGEWHDNRIADLATPFGWLSVTDLSWIEPGESVTWEGAPGEFTRADDPATGDKWVRFQLEPGKTIGPTSAALKVMSNPSELAEVRSADNTFEARVGRGQSLNWLVFDNTVVELLDRDGRVGIRRRDSKAPLLGRFIDIPTFEVDPAWVFIGRFTEFAQPEPRRIATAWPGLEIDETLAGTIEFEVDGQTLVLYASGSKATGLYVNFHDYTNGLSTVAWRRLDVGIPDANGNVFVDFNRAVNYPMAFTPYATCPAPVPENFLPIRVTAGERKPIQTLSASGVNTPVLLIGTSPGLDIGVISDYFTEYGVELTQVNVADGDEIPPLVGFRGLLVAGFDTPGEPVPNYVEKTLDLIADALAAHVPAVALGNASSALALLSSPGWQSSMSTGQLNLPEASRTGVPTDTLTITVSEDVARDPLFRGLVTWSAEGTSYISVRDMAAKLNQESTGQGSGDQQQDPVLFAWHKLVERFSRMVHAQN